MRDCEKMESLKHRYRKSKAPASMAGGQAQALAAPVPAVRGLAVRGSGWP